MQTLASNQLAAGFIFWRTLSLHVWVSVCKWIEATGIWKFILATFAPISPFLVLFLLFSVTHGDFFFCFRTRKEIGSHYKLDNNMSTWTTGNHQICFTGLEFSFRKITGLRRNCSGWERIRFREFRAHDQELWWLHKGNFLGNNRSHGRHVWDELPYNIWGNAIATCKTLCPPYFFG